MDIDHNKPYRIYRNLVKGGFSIQGYVRKKGYRVIDVLKSINAFNCHFQIYNKSRQRAIDANERNVHAYILCNAYEKATIFDIHNNTRLTNKNIPDLSMWSELTYNPFNKKGFIDKNTSLGILNADYLQFRQNRVFYPIHNSESIYMDRITQNTFKMNELITS